MLLDSTGFANNGNSFGGTATLGTNDANDLILETGGVEGLRIDQDGDVSIGTLADAVEALEVNGGVKLGNSAGTNAGTLRWTGTDFEGYDGTQWVSLTSGGGGGGGSGYGITVVKTADEVENLVSNPTATLQNDDELQFAIGADEDWYFRFVIQGNAATQPDFKFAVTAPAGATCDVAVTDAEGSTSISNLGCGVSSGTVAGSGNDEVYEVIGTVRNGGTAGNVTLQWAQDSANANNSTIYAGSSVFASSADAVLGGGSDSFVNDGNTFGGLATIGTNDNFGLNIETAGSTRLAFANTGEATFNSSVTVSSGGIAVTGNSSVTGSLSATSFSGSGLGLTALNASNISSGTLADARLSSNVALLDAEQTFTALNTFNSGLIVGTTTDTTAGAIRWNGADFEGYDGTQWLSFTSGGGGGGSSSPSQTTVRKSANENVNNSTTFQNDDHLFFPVGANETWTFRYVLQGVSSTTADLKFAITAPAGSTCSIGVIDAEGATTNSNLGCGVTSGLIEGTGSNEVYEVVGTVTSGGTAGNVRLQWAQNTAEATNSTLFTGSYLTAFIDGGGLTLLQGGNAFGSTVSVGSTDTFGLSLVTDGVARLSFSSAGLATFTERVTFNSDLDLGLSTFSSSATAARNITFSDESGTVCLDTNNCSYLEFASGTTQTDATNNDTISFNKTSATGDLINIQRGGTDVFEVLNSGAVEIQLTNANALRIMNAGGTDLFNVDTSANTVRVGSSTADGTGVLFILDTKNTAGDPTGINGAQYYNSNSNKFRCFENSTWKDCISSPSVRSFIDTVSDAVVDLNNVNYWDTGAENNNSNPNITPGATTTRVYGTVTMELTSNTNQDLEVTARVERSIGTLAVCGLGTPVGGSPGVFSTNTGAVKSSTVTFIDNPNTTSQVFYSLCSDTATVGTNGNITRIRVTLQEVTNNN